MRAFKINPDVRRTGLSIEALALLDAIWMARAERFALVDRRPGCFTCDLRSVGNLKVTALIECGPNVVDYAGAGLSFADAMSALDEIEAASNPVSEGVMPTWVERGRTLWRNIMRGNVIALHQSRADLGRAFACAEALSVLRKRDMLTSVQLDLIERTMAQEIAKWV